MKKQNTILRAAVALALAGGMASAFAASVGFDGTTAWAAKKVASEVPTTGFTATSTAAFEMTVGADTTSFAPSAGQSLQVTVTLNGGAKFAGSPSLGCSTTAATNASAASAFASAAGILNLGGAGSNQAVFTLGSAATTGAINRCFVSATGLTVTGAHSDVTESITFAYGSLSSSSVSNTLLTFESGLTAGKTVGTDVTAQVTASFTKLAAGATLLSAGQVTWGGDGTANSTADLATKLLLSDALGATSGSVTIAGNALLATTATTGAVWLISAGGVCATTGAAGALATAAGGASSITFTGLTPAQLTAGVQVCVQFNGTTAIQEGAITAKVGGTAAANYSLPTTTAETLVTVYRDGASTTVLNLPTSTAASSGTTGFLRIYNTSSSSGAFTASIYSDTGATVVSNCSLGTIAAGGAFAKSSAEIETLCSIPAASIPTGRYRLVINGAVSSLRAMATALSSTGVLVNLSGDSSTNNN